MYFHQFKLFSFCLRISLCLHRAVLIQSSAIYFNFVSPRTLIRSIRRIIHYSLPMKGNNYNFRILNDQLTKPSIALSLRAFNISSSWTGFLLLDFHDVKHGCYTLIIFISSSTIYGLTARPSLICSSHLRNPIAAETKMPIW